MVSEACALQEQTITGLGFVVHIVCLSVVLFGVHVAIVFPPNLTQWLISPLQPGVLCSVGKTLLIMYLLGVREAQWQLYCWTIGLGGEIAGPQVQHMAQAAITYGSQHPDLLRLDMLGSSGVNRGNCHRDLHSFCF